MSEQQKSLINRSQHLGRSVQEPAVQPPKADGEHPAIKVMFFTKQEIAIWRGKQGELPQRCPVEAWVGSQTNMACHPTVPGTKLHLHFPNGWQVSHVLNGGRVTAFPLPYSKVVCMKLVLFLSSHRESRESPTELIPRFAQQHHLDQWFWPNDKRREVILDKLQEEPTIQSAPLRDQELGITSPPSGAERDCWPRVTDAATIRDAFRNAWFHQIDLLAQEDGSSEDEREAIAARTRYRHVLRALTLEEQAHHLVQEGEQRSQADCQSEDRRFEGLLWRAQAYERAARSLLNIVAMWDTVRHEMNHISLLEGALVQGHAVSLDLLCLEKQAQVAGCAASLFEQLVQITRERESIDAGEEGEGNGHG